MSNKTRKAYTAEEKVTILRRHLINQVPISDLCDEYGFHPTQFYRWQRQFFETGIGKEVCARAIHSLSRRAIKPFVPVNCGAIPTELIENELFGHERAAYTGAFMAGKGVVAEAEGGTLFLDEIDALPPKAQVKLLRLFQEKEYRPLGSTKSKYADIRIIGASNCDLLEERRCGRIRDDFFYRISVLHLSMPPLRDRGHDVLLLADHFIKRFSRKLKRAPPSLSPATKEALLFYDWPGNVRELEHVIQRAITLADGRRVIDQSLIELPSTNHDQGLSFKEAKQRAISEFEISFLEKLLSLHHGNVTRAALASGKNPRALRHLVRKYGIDCSRFRN